MILLCLSDFLNYIIIILVVTFIIIILVTLYIYEVAYNMSLIGTFMTGCTFIPVVIIVIITYLCDILSKRESMLWWSSFPCIPVLILIN